MEFVREESTFVDKVIDIDDDESDVFVIIEFDVDIMFVVIIVIGVVVVVRSDVSRRFEHETCNGCSLVIINQKPLRVITSFDLNDNSVEEFNVKCELICL